MARIDVRHAGGWGAYHWRWDVVVAGRSVAHGIARTRREARLLAEAAATRRRLI